jgi:hypothetical protein
MFETRSLTLRKDDILRIFEDSLMGSVWTDEAPKDQRKLHEKL